jgi:hypothetical protein
MKCELLRDMTGHEPGDIHTPRLWKAGEINEGPDCWRHCLPDGLGKINAKPADEECQQRVDAWKVRHKKK